MQLELALVQRLGREAAGAAGQRMDGVVAVLQHAQRERPQRAHSAHPQSQLARVQRSLSGEKRSEAGGEG